MIKTIKEMLLDWLADITVIRLPLPTYYIYEVQVDDRPVQMKSTSSCRMYVHYLARRKYPNAKSIRVLKQTKSYCYC